MREAEKLNAIATMVIREYRKKNHRLKILLAGFLVLYMLTVLGFLAYIDGRLDRHDVAFAVASPLCMTVARAQAKTAKRTIFV